MSTNICLYILFSIYLLSLSCQNICLYQLACTYLSIQIFLFVFLINNIFFVYNFVLSMFLFLSIPSCQYFLSICLYFLSILFSNTLLCYCNSTFTYYCCIILLYYYCCKILPKDHAMSA